MKILEGGADSVAMGGAHGVNTVLMAAAAVALRCVEKVQIQ